MWYRRDNRIGVIIGCQQKRACWRPCCDAIKCTKIKAKSCCIWLLNFSNSKKMQKSVDRRLGMWYYTWAPRAAGKNDFWKRQKQSERTNMDTLKKRATSSKRSKSFWKKCLTKNHFCGKIIKSSAAKAEAHRTLKIEQYRKTCNGTYFRVGKTR